MASFTGVDCGVRGMFMSSNRCTYILNMDNTVTLVGGGQDYALTTLLPSSSNPKSLKDAVFVFYNSLVRAEKKIDTGHLIKFSGDSLVRVYRDIFLAYDYNIESWVLVRIIVS